MVEQMTSVLIRRWRRSAVSILDRRDHDRMMNSMPILTSTTETTITIRTKVRREKSTTVTPPNKFVKWKRTSVLNFSSYTCFSIITPKIITPVTNTHIIQHAVDQIEIDPRLISFSCEFLHKRTCTITKSSRSYYLIA